jgi:hypothetical protein
MSSAERALSLRSDELYVRQDSCMCTCLPFQRSRGTADKECVSVGTADKERVSVGTADKERESEA